VAVAALAVQPVELTKRIAAAAITVTVSFRMGPLIGSGLRAPVGYPQTPAQESGPIRILLSTQPHPELDQLLIQADVAFGSNSDFGARNREVRFAPGERILRFTDAKSEKCHVWTAPGWQDLFSRFAALVGAAMCSAF
jgi:hypothetical protein